MANVRFIEEAWRVWRRDPQAVGPEWRAFFLGFEQGVAPQDGDATLRVARSSAAGTPRAAAGGLVPAEQVHKQSRVDSLLWAYRDVGYLYARLNPLATGYPRTTATCGSSPGRATSSSPWRSSVSPRRTWTRASPPGGR